MSQSPLVALDATDDGDLECEWGGSSEAEHVGGFALGLASQLVKNQREAGEKTVALVLKDSTKAPGLWAAVLRQTIYVHARYSVRYCRVVCDGQAFDTEWDDVLPGTVDALANLTMAVMRHTAHKVSRTEGLALHQVVGAVGQGRAPMLHEALVASTIVQHTMGIREKLGHDAHRDDHLANAIAACTTVRKELVVDPLLQGLIVGVDELAKELCAQRSPTVPLHAHSFVAPLLAKHARPGQLWGGPIVERAVRERARPPEYTVLFPPLDGDSVEVRWHEDRFIDARLDFLGDRGLGAEDITIDPHWATVYRYRDACEAARSAGVALPSANTALTEAQRTTLEALADDWAGTVLSASSRFPREIRKFIEWNGLRVTDKEAGGVVYCELRGHQGGGPESSFSEHGTEATLLGNRVYFAADDDRLPMPGEGERPGRKRLGCNATSVDEALYNRPPPRPIVARQPMPHDVDAARAAFLDSYVEADQSGAERLLADVRWWAASHPVPLPAEALSAPLARLRPLVDACLFTIPLGLLHAATTPESLRTAVELGADLNGPQREGGSARNTPLMRHRRDLSCFETLLELGADPRTMLDDKGALFRHLEPPQHTLFITALAKHGLTLPTS